MTIQEYLQMPHRVSSVRALARAAALGLFLAFGGQQASGSETPVDARVDCPSARTPYSSKTVLMDLLINPATRSVLDKDLPDLLTGLPELVTGTAPPSFSAIFDVATVANFKKMPLSAATVATLDADLSAVPVTETAALARCARYDEGSSGLPAAVRKPAVLVFSKVNGYRDVEALNAGTAALRRIGAIRGWTMVFTENGAAMNAKDLSHFNVVVWNNVSGDVLTITQREAFRRYIEHGGGFAAFHGSGGDSRYDWDWYVDALIGARFTGHPRSPHFQSAAVIMEDPKDWVTRGLPATWMLTEEWYSFEASPRLTGAHVLERLDESTYEPTNGDTDLHMGDHPIAWTRCVGDGRSFYTAIGHRPENYSEPHVQLLLERGIAWAAGQGPTRCLDGKEIPRSPRSRSS
jgi:type 1 glutamine amidotransferase